MEFNLPFDAEVGRSKSRKHNTRIVEDLWEVKVEIYASKFRSGHPGDVGEADVSKNAIVRCYKGESVKN